MFDFSQANSPLRVRAGGVPEDDILLVGVSGAEGLSELFRYDLDMVAPAGAPVDFAKVLGEPTAVSIAANGVTRHLHGVVSRLTEGATDEQFTRYRAVLVPAVWLLTQRVQSRTFQHLSVPEIVAECLDGLPVDADIRGTFHARDYCVQYRESDWDFVARLLEEEGIYYYFTHSEDGCRLVLANTPDGHADVPTGRAAKFAGADGVRHADRRVREWSKVQELSPAKLLLRDYCFEMPEDRLEAGLGIQDAVAVGRVTHTLAAPAARELEVYDYPGGYAGRFDGVDRGGADKPADLRHIFDDNARTAKLRIGEHAARALTIEGAGELAQFTAGHGFDLEDHGHGDGAYVLTRVTHTASVGESYRSGAGMVLQYANTFACLPADLPFVPPRVTPRPTVQGTQTAVVVGPPGEEIFCDKYGRVKVQFHWDRHGRQDADSSCWIRVATVWAGKGYGVLHVPRVGQEVVVDFLEGDPDQPIIVGSVYNAEQMPPVRLPEERMFSGSRSNSTPNAAGFNGVVSNDTKGKEMVTVNAQYDMTYHVGHDEKQTVDNNRTITVTGTHTETVVKDTKITVSEGNYKFDVSTGKADISVKGPVVETFDNTQKTQVTSSIEIASASSFIHLTSPTEIKFTVGGTTLTLTPDGITLVAAKIHSDAGIKLSGVSPDVHFEGTTTATLKAPSLLTEGASEATHQGALVTVAATSKATVAVGGSTVVCDPGGVKVAGTKITSAATGPHEITGAVIKLN